ncbi:MAG TPA: TIGR03960 family B12-binding radical SAM protein [Myxococcota bacterium]|jgi:radical SAM family uncharacterized protein/radical SAM-linked protein|nr:TIGR03960 family B12-binding radical SAM protein [Myxococcota bacterium]
MTLAQHPYAALFPRVEKPSRYVGGEHNAVVKPPEAVDGRMVLAFPDVYEVGSSHLGTKILYSVLNAHPRVQGERAFTPWPDMERELRAAGLPLLSLETGTPLGAFDVVGVSLQYELTYTNVLTLLDLGGVPLRGSARGDDDPLVLAGGPTATHPEPLADFVDAFFIGEAEEALPGLVLDWAQWRRQGVPRRERLARLAARGFLYVPSLYDTEIDPATGFVVVGVPLDPRAPARVGRTWIDDLDRFPFPADSPVPHAEAIFDRQAVEIARGCTEGCRFCQAGMIYRPVRERSPRSVVGSVLGGLAAGGYDETSLTSLSTADYSAIHPLMSNVMDELRGRKVSLSVSSLRAYGLPEDLLDGMRSVRATGLTFAPEAGTQRMRDVVNKNVTEADLLDTAERVFSRGWNHMKLYFMIGLPTEEDEDVRGIIDTAAKALEVGRKHKRRRPPEVVASVSSHVPKPHTPFQWAALDTVAQLQEKQRVLAAQAKRTGVTFKGHDPQTSWLEGIFARGDRRLCDVIEHAWRAGARFDGWDEHLRFEVWLEALRACGVDAERYLGTIPVDARLPWDHIDVGLEDGFLLTEYRRALKDRASPPCGKVFGKLLHATNLAEARAERGKLVCYDCGIACDMARMREERIEFLAELGAAEPPPAPVPAAPPESLPEVAAPEATLAVPAAPAQRRRQERAPAFGAAQGEGVKYRVVFVKRGVAALTGHLDLTRLLARVVRRAGFMPIYSQGFHPKPDFAFGPALALGMESAGEAADLRLVEDVPAGELVARLNAVASEGVRFLDAARLGSSDKGIGAVVRVADFTAALDRPATLDCGALLARTALDVERALGTDKRRTKTVDARRFLLSVEQPAPDRIWMRLDCGPNGSVRPAEVLDALGAASGLAPEARPHARFERVALWALGLGDDAAGAPLLVGPLDLERMRVRRGPAVGYIRAGPAGE